MLSIRYQVHDGDNRHTAMTLGGVGLNFSGVARTQTYIDSYQRLQSLQDDIQVSLPNHQSMGRVFQRRDALQDRANGDPHPFVDAAGYRADLATFVANAQRKLEQEQSGTAPDPTQALLKAIAAPPQARVQLSCYENWHKWFGHGAKGFCDRPLRNMLLQPPTRILLTIGWQNTQPAVSTPLRPWRLWVNACQISNWVPPLCLPFRDTLWPLLARR